MWNHKRHFVLISATFFLGSLLAVLTFGQDYSSEPADHSPARSVGRASEPPRPAIAKPVPQSKRPAMTYSTEDIAESPAGTDPGTTTTSTYDHKVYRTRRVPRRPDSPNVPETPEVVDSGGGSPVVDGGAMILRPYRHLAHQRLCSDGELDGWFWPGLLGIDLSYSWSGDSGGGELTYCGYRYLWGDNPDYRDDSGCCQAHSVMASDPNATDGDYTTYSTEDIRPSDYRPRRPSEANGPPLDVTVSETASKSESKVSKNE